MTDKREKSLVKQKVKEERMTEQRILVLKKKKEARAWIAFHAKQDSTAVTQMTSGAVQRKVMAVFETREPMVQLTILPTGMMWP